MSHLTDGELHAYLDGGLGAFEDSGAEQVRSHLGSCSDCQTRLVEARRVRDEASGILSLAGPQSVVSPPFAEIESRVAGGPPGSLSPGSTGRQRMGPQSLAWAASLAVALTAGWLARGTVGTGLPDVRLDDRAEVSESLTESARGAGRRVPADDGDRAQRQARERVVSDQLALRDSSAAPMRTESKSAELDARDAVRMQDPAEEAYRADEPQAVAEGEEAGADTEALAKKETADEANAQLESSVDRRMANAAAPTGSIAGAAAPSSPEWMSVDRGAAEQLLGGRLRVHEHLPVISVRVRSSEGSPEVWTSQQLASGHTLDLVQVPADTASVVPGGRYESTQELRWVEWIRVDGFLIEARAPVSPDSLRALVNSLKD